MYCQKRSTAFRKTYYWLNFMRMVSQWTQSLFYTLTSNAKNMIEIESLFNIIFFGAYQGSTSRINSNGVVVITTVQLHLTWFELSFCVDLNPPCRVSEICDGENFWHWSRLKTSINTFRRSTIPANAFQNTFQNAKLLSSQSFRKTLSSYLKKVFSVNYSSKTVPPKNVCRRSTILQKHNHHQDPFCLI